MSDFAELRERMVRRQIEARGIHDPAILDAFREVPREAFVSPDYAAALDQFRAGVGRKILIEP